MHRHALTLLALSALALTVAPASAASSSDLTVTVTTPTVAVDQSGVYSVAVSNIGGQSAQNVSVTIDLPKTATSPQVHLMGVLGAFDSRCTRAGTRLTCNLGTIRARRAATPITFSLALPYAIAPLAIDVDANSTSADPNSANDTRHVVVTPQTVPISFTAPVTVHGRHCTGQNLTSFFECELYPSSISGFDTVLAAGGTISVPAEPTVTGTWTHTGDRLTIQYVENGNVLGTFDGRGVSAKCFEGSMPFTSGYMAMYEVCLP
ncbi:MAG: hypothetical protein IPK71_04285 [Myxococcales bacterium]|nr:hypothetical protein [Myxococcales bacterium]